MTLRHLPLVYDEAVDLADRPMSSWDRLLGKVEPQGHLVQLYGADEGLLTRNVSHYLWEGLKRGDGLLVIATPEHSEAFSFQLKELGADAERAVRERQLVFLDARETLARFMVGGEPDWDRFESAIGAAMREVRPAANHTGRRAYGEMVGLLWKAGQYSPAIRLEKFWNKLLKSDLFNLFCAYPIDVFGNEFQISAIDALLCAHTHLVPAGTNGELERAINRAMAEILGSKVDGLTQLIKANYRPSWAAIPRAEAVILWLRNNLPDYADEILARARQYYRVSHLTATIQ
jgi:hypothetical protein